MSSLDCHDTGRKKSQFLDFLIFFYPFSVVIVNVQVGLRVYCIEYGGCKILVWAQLRSQPTLPRVQCTPKLLSCSSQEN